MMSYNATTECFIAYTNTYIQQITIHKFSKRVNISKREINSQWTKMFHNPIGNTIIHTTMLFISIIGILLRIVNKTTLF